jgi:NAD(P)-dependent dehydrogenase (short-subunit alcohol dehydrogenase family)
MTDQAAAGARPRRTAVVTGAARGAGRQAAIALARQGVSIAGIDITGPVGPVPDREPATGRDLADTGDLVRRAGGGWLPVEADQRDIGAIRDAAERIEARFGGVDIVFASAGIQAFKPLLEMQDADWHDEIDVILNGTANVVRAFAPLLVRRGGGRIIITCSTRGGPGTLDGSACSASGWALIGLMKSAALELGPHGITVNTLVPGPIGTAPARHEDRHAQPIRAAGREPDGAAGVAGVAGDDEATARRLLAAESPLDAPWIEPVDVAPMVTFLASQEAASVSGTSFAVTAGGSANAAP